MQTTAATLAHSLCQAVGVTLSTERARQQQCTITQGVLLTESVGSLLGFEHSSKVKTVIALQ